MRKYVSFIAVFLFTISLFSQKKPEDFGIWYGSEFSYKISKGTYLVGAVSLRTADNASSIRKFHYEIGAEKKFFKQLVVGLKYRNRFMFDYDGNSVNNRFILDLSNKQKIGNFGVQVRSRLQYTFGNDKFRFDERIRLKVDYKLEDNLKVYVFNEVFFRLGASKREPFRTNRFGFGAKYEFSKKLSLDLSYMRSVDFNTKKPGIYNVLQAELNVNF